jgi:hypothetical protein
MVFEIHRELAVAGAGHIRWNGTHGSVSTSSLCFVCGSLHLAISQLPVSKASFSMRLQPLQILTYVLSAREAVLPALLRASIFRPNKQSKA